MGFTIENKELAELAELALGLKPPPSGRPYSTLDGRLRRAFNKIPGNDARYGVAKQREIEAFYVSAEWRRVRYDALKANDGRCELCGKSKHDGIFLNVDHIKNLRDHWHLRLKIENLQVLCNVCNHGKGNRDDTDWRQENV